MKQKGKIEGPKINISWYESKDEEEQKEMKAVVIAAERALKRLDKILENKIKATERAGSDRDNYKCSAWPYLQADYVATVRTLNNIRDLIKINYED